MGLRQYEAVMKAAADPTRARILMMLEGGELCVCQIIAVLGLSPSTVSKHLSLLRAAALVRDRKEGKWVHYELDRESEPATAGAALRLVPELLGGDPVVRRDRARLRRARRQVGPRACDAPGPRAEARP